MKKQPLVLLLIVTFGTTTGFLTEEQVLSDDDSPVKVAAESLIEGLLTYSKTQNSSPLPPRLDLVFVLDSSSLVGSAKQFNSLKKFIQGLVSEFSISPSTTRIGLILCSTRVHLQFGLDKFVNKECTLKALKNLRKLDCVGNNPFSGGSHVYTHENTKLCFFKVALLLNLSEVFECEASGHCFGQNGCLAWEKVNCCNGYRLGSRYLLNKALDFTRFVFEKNDLDATKLVFIVSSGRQRHDIRTTESAAKLREDGIEVFLLCVHSNRGISRDKGIASEPLRTHKFHVDSYDDLVEVANEIKGKGLDRTCTTNGITVYDECRRRCRCSNGQMVDCHRVRKDFTSMTLEERRLYIHALKTVSTVRPYKRVYDVLTSYHPRWFKVVHRLKYFFPWHRWYILIFENFLRQVDCRVTVPYWDWSRAVSKGAVFRSSHIQDVWHPGAHGLGGNGKKYDLCVQTGPFCKGSWLVYLILRKNSRPSCLTREFNACYSRYLLNSTRVSKLFRLPLHKFKAFEKKVRNTMHDNFHNAIGGVMSLRESANAPEFWFHHGYLDKLWADWQKRGPEFKHQYYHGVKSNLPGANFRGARFIDLSRQPFCVKVVHDQPIDIKEREEEFDQSIEETEPLYRCHDDSED